jgi:hypothetical protein
MTWLHTVYEVDDVNEIKLYIANLKKNYEISKEDEEQDPSSVKYTLYSLKFMTYIYNGDLVNSIKYHKKLKEYESDNMDAWLFGGEPLELELEDCTNDNEIKVYEGEEAIRQCCDYFKEDVESRTEQIKMLIKYKITH